MTSTVQRILVVDDDPEIRKLLARYIESQGFRVHLAASCRELREKLATNHIDLIVLDVMLPDGSGLEVCRDLRAQRSSVPIILLTALKEDVDRIIGLEIGADDYLPKPFNPRELVARIHAVLRRRTAPPPAGAPAEGGLVTFGDITLDMGTRELRRGEEITRLTTGEFGLLRVLVEHPRQPMSRDKLMELARGREYEVFDRAIDVQMSRLRKLIEDDPSKPRYLQTVWGFGYVFVPDGSKQ